MIKNAQTYEIMTPESVGVKKTTLVIGKHSGKNAIASKLVEMGFQLGPNQLPEIVAKIKALADRKKHVFDEDIEAIVDESVTTEEGQPVLVFASATQTESGHTGVVKLRIDGVERLYAGEGNGPIDSLFSAVKSAIPHGAKVTRYHVDMIGEEDSDAQADAYVRLEVVTAPGVKKSASAKAVDPDTNVASARAYLHAVLKLKAKSDTAVRPTDPLPAK